MHAVTMTKPPVGPDTASLPDLSADELLGRVASRRDRAALVALFDLFGPKLKAMLIKQGAPLSLAEDLVQDTLVNVWRKAHLYAPERGSASAWIFTVARNLRIDHFRRQSSQPYQDIDTIELTADEPSSHARLEQSEIVARVGVALGALPPDQREVVELSFIAELPHGDIAQKLGIPLGTVKSRLRLAYQRLRPILEDLQ